MLPIYTLALGFAIAVGIIIGQIIERRFSMAAIDDLNTNIATLNTNVAALTAALAASQAGSVPSAAVEAAAGQVGAAATAVASLTVSLAPAPTAQRVRASSAQLSCPRKGALEGLARCIGRTPPQSEGTFDSSPTLARFIFVRGG